MKKVRFVIGLLFVLCLFSFCRVDSYAMTRHTIERRVQGLGAYYPGNDFGHGVDLSVKNYVRHEWHGVAGTTKISTYESSINPKTKGTMLFMVPTVRSGFEYRDCLDIWFKDVGNFNGRDLNAQLHFDSIKFGPYTPNGKYTISYSSNPTGVFLLQNYTSSELFFGRSDQHEYFPGLEQRYDACKDITITVKITYADTGEVCEIPFYQYVDDLDNNNRWNTYGSQEGITFGNGFTDDLYVYDGFRCEVNNRTVQVPNDGRNHNYSDFYNPPPVPGATSGEKLSTDPRVAEAGRFLNACWGATTNGQFTMTFHGANAVAEMNLRCPYIYSKPLTVTKSGFPDGEDVYWNIRYSFPDLKSDLLAPFTSLETEDPLPSACRYTRAVLTDSLGNQVNNAIDVSYDTANHTVRISFREAFLQNRSNYGRNWIVKLYTDLDPNVQSVSNTVRTIINKRIPVTSPPLAEYRPAGDVGIGLYKYVVNPQESYGPGDTITFAVAIDTSSYTPRHVSEDEYLTVGPVKKFLQANSQHYLLDDVDDYLTNFVLDDAIPYGLELAGEPHMFCGFKYAYDPVDEMTWSSSNGYTWWHPMVFARGLQFDRNFVDQDGDGRYDGVVLPDKPYYEYDNTGFPKFLANGGSDHDYRTRKTPIEKSELFRYAVGWGGLQNGHLENIGVEGNRDVYNVHGDYLFYQPELILENLCVPTCYKEGWSVGDPYRPADPTFARNYIQQILNVEKETPEIYHLDPDDIVRYCSPVWSPISQWFHPNKYRSLEVYDYEKLYDLDSETLANPYTYISPKCKLSNMDSHISLASRSIHIDSSYLFAAFNYLALSTDSNRYEYRDNGSSLMIQPHLVYTCRVTGDVTNADVINICSVSGDYVPMLRANGYMRTGSGEYDFRDTGAFFRVDLPGTPNLKAKADVTVHLGGYQVTTEVVNGQIDDSVYEINTGDNVSIAYQPNPGYYLERLEVDGTPVSVGSYPKFYTFSDIHASHHIKAVYAKGFSVTTDAVNGMIDESYFGIRPGNSHTVRYEPMEGYMLEKIEVDGSLVDMSTCLSQYTFTDIQADHHIKVWYKPMYKIETSIEHGTITDTIIGIPPGDNKTITYSPDSGYYVKSVTVDGMDLTGDALKGHLGSYVFSNIHENHTIHVVCAPYPTVTVTKRIENLSKIVWAKGDPVFTFMISGTDYLGDAHMYTRPVAFGPSDGQSKSLVLKIPAGRYTVSELCPIGWALVSVQAGAACTVNGFAGVVDTRNADAAAVTFTNRVDDWRLYTENGVRVNQLR